MRWVVSGGVVIVLVVALYFVLTQTRTRGDERQVTSVADSRSTGSAASHKSAEPPPTLPDRGPRQPSQAEHGSARQIVSAPRQEPRRSAATLPATIEEAIANNPALAKDLACRDEQAKFSMDHQLKLIAGIRDCLAGRTRSTGRIDFMLHFDNDPATRRSVGTTLEPLSSELAPEDDQIALECVKAFHVGSVLMNSAKYGTRTERHHTSSFNLPLEDSYIYKMVREGSYTAGTNFGCEVP